MNTSGKTTLVFKMAQNGAYTELSKKGYTETKGISPETAAKNAEFRLQRKNNPRKIHVSPEKLAYAKARFAKRFMEKKNS